MNVQRVGATSLNDQRQPVWDKDTKHYAVNVGGHRLGTFGFSTEEPTEHFEFRLAPDIGDIAPDVELVDVGTGKPLHLKDLRGKVICLDFWAN